MTLCPIAMMVHCTGCPFVKFCPAKTILGDYGKTSGQNPPSQSDSNNNDKDKSQDEDKN